MALFIKTFITGLFRYSERIIVPQPRVVNYQPRRRILPPKQDEYSVSYDQEEEVGNANIKTILKPYHFPQEKPEEDRVLMRDFDYVDNLYKELQVLTDEGLMKKSEVEKISKRSKKLRETPEIITLVNGRPVDESAKSMDVADQQMESRTDFEPTRKVRFRDQQEPEMRAPQQSGVKSFGSSRKRNVGSAASRLNQLLSSTQLGK